MFIVFKRKSSRYSMAKFTKHSKYSSSQTIHFLKKPIVCSIIKRCWITFRLKSFAVSFVRLLCVLVAAASGKSSS